jgi:hypothetical protein
MASGFTTATRNSILDDLFYTPTVYLALCTSDPGDAADMSECEVAAAYDYARTAIQFNTNADAGSISNDAACEFPAANGGAWGLISHAAICAADVEDVDDAIMTGALTVSKQIDDTDQIIFPIGGVTASIAVQA